MTPERVPEVGSLVLNPTVFRSKTELSVTASYSDPALGKIHYEWVELKPMATGAGSSAVRNPVLPSSFQNLLPVSELAQTYLEGRLAENQYEGATRACPRTDATISPGASGREDSTDLPTVIVTDGMHDGAAVVELKPDAENPSLWHSTGGWVAVAPAPGSPNEVRFLREKPRVTPQKYQVGPVSVPVGFQLSSEGRWVNPKKETPSNTELKFNVNARQLNQSTLSYRVNAPASGASGTTARQFLLIARPLQQSAVAGMALKDGENRATFVGYETQKSDRAGHLIVQMTDSSPTRPGVQETRGFVVRLGNSSEATGLYRLQSGSLVASAALTPARFADVSKPKEVSSELSFGLSKQADVRTPVTAFVNVALLKDWATANGVSGALSGGAEFPKSGTRIYAVVPFDFLSNADGGGARAGVSVPVGRK